MRDLWMLNEEQMCRIEPFLPLSHRITKVGDRRIVSGIFYVIKHELTFSLSGGQAHDAPEGRALLEAWGKQDIGPLTGLPLLMDRAYEGDETRQLALDLGFTPVVPPKANRTNWYRVSRLIPSSRAMAALRSPRQLGGAARRRFRQTVVNERWY